MKLDDILTINIVIFSIIGILHLIRAVSGWQAQIGNFVVPIWLSYVAVIVAAILVYLNYSVKKG